MAKKKEGLQIDVRSDPQWRQLCRRDGLIVIDVYAGWAGPCTSMVNFLKRVKQDITEKHEPYSNKLLFATACTDKIEDLLGFKDHSEPTWLFLAGGGKPVRVFKGCHVPNLADAILDEFEHELLCIEGKARRNVISIDDDETRKRKFEAEAQRLADMLKDEEEPALGIKEARHESSIMLETIMSAYTIAVIQPFLLSQIAEIKEYLSSDFNVIGDAKISIDDYAARNLYRIPYEVEEPVPEKPKARKSTDVDPDEEQNSPRKSKRKVPVVLPPGILGETAFLLLESTEIKNILESGGKPSGALQTADDWLRLKVGPRIFEQALEHSPNSLHATYGKGQFLTGVWCPRRYDDKRHILLTYFPQFLLDKVLPYEVGEEYVPKRYRVYIYSAAKIKDIMDIIKSHEVDIFAHAKMKITAEQAGKMAKSRNVSPAETAKIKQSLTSGNMLCVSVNGRNETLGQTLQGATPAPLYYSVDPKFGAVETAALFPNLNAKYEEEADEALQKFAARAKVRIPDLEKPEEDGQKDDNGMVPETDPSQEERPKRPSTADDKTKRPTIPDDKTKRPSTADDKTKRPTIPDDKTKRPSTPDDKTKRPTNPDEAKNKQAPKVSNSGPSEQKKRSQNAPSENDTGTTENNDKKRDSKDGKTTERKSKP